MVKAIIRSYLINIFALWVAAQLIGGFHLAQGYKSLALVGAGFTALHLVIKPILTAILGPINFLTLGAIGLLIDSAILYAVSIYFPEVSLIPWHFAGLEVQGFTIPAYSFNIIGVLILAAFVINLVRSTLLTLIT